jgi:hypothetical protein
MGFDPNKLPIIKGAWQSSTSYPIANPDSLSGIAYLNGQKIPIQEIAIAGERSFVSPKGWRGHIEIENESV